MDDMAVDPMGVLRDVLDFLGLDFSQEDESEVCENMACSGRGRGILEIY